MYFKEMFCLLTLFAISTAPVQSMSNIDIPVLTLTRDPKYSELLPTHTRYQITSIHNISLMDTVFECMLRNPGCVEILHNADIRLSLLMRCYLNERSVNREINVPGWIFYADLNVCKEGWMPYSGHCYIIPKNKAGWSNAQENCLYLQTVCNTYGAYLLQTETHEEALWVSEALLKPVQTAGCSLWYDCSYWLGANDITTEGLFSWSHGTEEFQASLWYPGQPNNNGNQDCVALSRSAHLHDYPCSAEIEFVCERVSH